MSDLSQKHIKKFLDYRQIIRQLQEFSPKTSFQQIPEFNLNITNIQIQMNWYSL
jgi:hypothetical protein